MDWNAFLDGCRDHYRKARKKHPHFADNLLDRTMLARGIHAHDVPREEGFNEEAFEREHIAAIQKRWLMEDALKGAVTPEKVLLCEISEVNAAVAEKDYGHALDECLDCIAVVLRWMDMIRKADGEAVDGEAVDGELPNEFFAKYWKCNRQAKLKEVSDDEQHEDIHR